MEGYEEPLTEFLDGLPNPATRNHYKRFLGYFFEFLKLDGDLKSQSNLFAKRAKKEPDWSQECVKKFIRFQKQRVERKEINV